MFIWRRIFCWEHNSQENILRGKKMPEMTILGWFHTILGIGAVLTGFYAIAKFKIISLENKIGQIYVVLTAIVAGSALGIYNQGGFGIAHILAVLTLIALVGAIVMEKFKIFGGFSKYFQALTLVQQGTRFEPHAHVTQKITNMRGATTYKSCL